MYKRQLSSLLQSTLIKKDELIPFDDELRNLKNYCDIQQLRYAGRFEMEYQIEVAAGYWTVPRFILQPLVENSILHGTADEDDFVTITAVSYTHLDVYKRQVLRVFSFYYPSMLYHLISLVSRCRSKQLPSPV